MKLWKRKHIPQVEGDGRRDEIRQVGFASLPHELLLEILQLLPRQSLLALRQCCRVFAAITTPNLFETLRIRVEAKTRPAGGADFRYCVKHGCYDGSAHPCDDGLGDGNVNGECGWYSCKKRIAVEAVTKGGWRRWRKDRIDLTNLRLALLLQMEPRPAMLLEARELVLSLSDKWVARYPPCTPKWEVVLKSFRKYFLVELLDALPTLRRLRVLIPVTFPVMDRAVRYTREIVDVICKHCTEKGVELHVSIIAAFSVRGTSTTPSTILGGSLSGLTSFTFVIPAPWPIDKDMEETVASILKRSPALKAASVWGGTIEKCGALRKLYFGCREDSWAPLHEGVYFYPFSKSYQQDFDEYFSTVEY